MDMDQAKQTFVVEAQELLVAMEGALLAVERETDRTESVNAMFRAVHTIKGSAGLFGLDAITGFAHTLESALDRVRSGQLELDGNLVRLLFEGHDHLSDLVTGIPGEGPLTSETEQRGQDILDQVRRLLETSPGSPDQAGMVDAQAEARPAQVAEAGSAHWHLSVRFARDLFRHGLDPAAPLACLAALGRIVHRNPLFQHLPQGEAFDPESCYLGLELDLEAKVDRKTLEDVFEFVRDDSRVLIIPPQSKVEEYIRLIRSVPEDARFLGEILIASGCITHQDLEQALHTQIGEIDPGGAGPGRRLGTILVEDQAVPAPVVAAALWQQKHAAEAHSADSKVVKVQADKLDRLVDLVGELVIAGASASLLAAETKHGRMIESAARVGKLVEEIRDNALSLRMVPIGDTFNRFRRIVRDVSKSLGKAIELEIHGAEAELDKSIVEKLSDPLMHLVRNAIDHGIEPLAVRRERSKPEAGSLSLNAFHESGNIVVEVADDGNGLDRARILAKALERGLAAPGAELTDSELSALIFEPGFSTARAVTDISGRGVGMDVVRKNIEELRGSIEVESYEGSGTTFRIRLPLTLAIIDGFRVETGGACYVVPLGTVIECLDLAPFLESESNHLINLRGEVLPFLRLREVFQLAGNRPEKECAVVVQNGENRAGLVVDRLVGEFQTVIKPLGDLFRNIKGLGGSTILGSGEVALILDVPELIQLASAT